MERWVDEALDEAKDRHAALAIIRLDTPGGLDTAMRSIVKDVLAAPMPVVVYVSPDGARAASAGLFVTEAADVAAMAPQTNIGSATPISLGGGGGDEVLGRKVRNDAAAYVRALAEGHGRDGDLPERMVRDAENVTARRAVEAGVVDLVAASERALLERLDGFRVRGPKRRTLRTDGLRIVQRDTPFRYEVLQFLVNPTIAYVFLIAGLAGLAIELFTPGAVGPGVLGGIALLLGLVGTAFLPVTAAGVILLVTGLALFVAEAKVQGHGVLGVAGIIALIGAGLILFDTDSAAFEVSLPAAIATGAFLGGLTLLAVSKGAAARRRPARGGRQQLLGQVGTVRVPLDPQGQVFVSGALWRARSLDPEVRLEPGERVRVEGVEGLTLSVRPERGE